MKEHIKTTRLLLSIITIIFLLTSCVKKTEDNINDDSEDEPIVNSTFLKAKINGTNYDFEPVAVSYEDFYGIIGEPIDPEENLVFVIQGIGGSIIDDGDDGNEGILGITIQNYNGPGTYNIDDEESTLIFSFGVALSYWGSASEVQIHQEVLPLLKTKTC